MAADWPCPRVAALPPDSPGAQRSAKKSRRPQPPPEPTEPPPLPPSLQLSSAEVSDVRVSRGALVQEVLEAVLEELHPLIERKAEALLHEATEHARKLSTELAEALSQIDDRIVQLRFEFVDARPLAPSEFGDAGAMDQLLQRGQELFELQASLKEQTDQLASDMAACQRVVHEAVVRSDNTASESKTAMKQIEEEMRALKCYVHQPSAQETRAPVQSSHTSGGEISPGAKDAPPGLSPVVSLQTALEAAKWQPPGAQSKAGGEIDTTLTVTLRRADGMQLGVEVTPLEKALRIEKVKPAGAVAAWNRQVYRSTQSPIMLGDMIVGVNGIADDPEGMLEECKLKCLLALTILRKDQTKVALAGPVSPKEMRASASVFVPSNSSARRSC